MKMNVEIEVPEGYELLNNSASSMLVDDINKVVAYGFNVVKKHDPHSELKEQYALDVETCKSIDSLEAWQFYQFRITDSNKWNDHFGEPIWSINHKYRRHPHTDAMIEYHKCSDADKKRWQSRPINSGFPWLNCPSDPIWDYGAEYRIKPRTIKINGVEYNAPMNVAPEIGTEYWLLSPYGPIHYVWEDSDLDAERLESNYVFATEFDCQAVCDAFNAILLSE